MPYRRPPRLSDACYVGAQRVFLTMCTFRRAPYFVDRELGERVREQLLNISARRDVEVLAYCFMPDHLHLLAEGRAERADCRKAADVFRRVSGAAFRRQRGSRLWQDGYFDRVLRHEEATLDVVRYILSNPVRGGLSADAMAYPLLGSGRWDVSELLAACARLKPSRYTWMLD